jgi:hypothetical protein
MKRCLLAATLLAVSTNAGLALPPFDARIEAKQADDGIEITAIIANHSHHSACFMATNQGSYVLRYSDGIDRPGYISSESWRDGTPPALIQLVPSDDESYRYFWFRIPRSRSDAKIDRPVSIETSVNLIDCKDFFADTGVIQRRIFSAALNAPIQP